MVVKFQQGQRGAAGESIQSGRGFNFSNLYNANKDKSFGQNMESEVSGQAAGLREGAADSLARNKVGSTQGNNQQMANMVGQAKGLADKAENFSIGNEAQKAGASAYQGGLIDFFGGGNTANKNVRKFGNIYGQMQNKQSELMGSQHLGINDTRLPNEAPPTRQFDTIGQERADVEKRNRDMTQGRGDRLQTNDRLTWGLKTGRISDEQFERARTDPAYWQELTDWLNGEGSRNR